MLYFAEMFQSFREGGRDENVPDLGVSNGSFHVLGRPPEPVIMVSKVARTGPIGKGIRNTAISKPRKATRSEESIYRAAPWQSTGVHVMPSHRSHYFSVATFFHRSGIKRQIPREGALLSASLSLLTLQ